MTFQVIWRLFFHANWRIVWGTKGADPYDRIGFVVGACTEDRYVRLDASRRSRHSVRPAGDM